MKELLKNMLEEQKHLICLDSQVRKSLQTAPEGSLRSSVSHHSIQYYHMNTNAPNRKVGQYIRKSNSELVKMLAQKAYDEKLHTIIQARLRVLDQSIECYQQTALKNIFTALPENLQEIVDSRGLSDELFAKAWMETPYPCKPFQMDDPEIYTDRNERVRSKSEKIIADKLFHMNIPYRYEARLQLSDGTILHPDFTILNVRTREVFYLEHLGSMDKGEYSGKVAVRLALYERNGIFIGKQLILTYETAGMPLDTKLLTRIIQDNFL